MASVIGFSRPAQLPKLVLADGRAQDILNTLEDALAEGGNIFRQGEGPNLRGVIVQELTQARRKQLIQRQAINVPPGLLLPVLLTESHVQDYAEREFMVLRQAWNKKTNQTEEKPADFRTALAKRLIQARLASLRPLRGIAYAPIMRRDGTLVRDPGYDPATQLWLVDTIPPFAVPDSPTKPEAEAAYNGLCRLLTEHPFETEEDRVGGVAHLMAAALRPSAERMPLLVADAPYGRTGKDFLLATAALVGSGFPPIIVALSDSREEQAKRIGHALLLGGPFVNLSNLNGTLRADEISPWLTEGGVVTRAYGTVGGPKFAPNGGMLATSGNNIIVGGELPERSCWVRQNARMENPGERTFKQDPHQMVRGDRGAWLAHVFTIARWAVCGADYQAPAVGGFGGFDEFNRLIRAPLMALTGHDPCWRLPGELEAARQNEPARPLIDALATLFQVKEAFCAHDINQKLKAKPPVPGLTDDLAPLRDDQQKLGYRLKKAVGKHGSDVTLEATVKPKGGRATAYYQLLALPTSPSSTATII